MNIWPKKSANWCSFFLSVDTPALASSSLKRSRVAFGWLTAVLAGCPVTGSVSSR